MSELYDLKPIIMIISPERIWLSLSLGMKRPVRCLLANPRRFICLVRARTLLVSPVRSAGVCVHNTTPAARTHSAPFSEEKTLMAFVSFGPMLECLSEAPL